MKEYNRKKYYLTYTAIFIIACLIAYAWHIYYGKIPASRGDGIRQHYKVLSYYGVYLRRILKGLVINHSLTIPQWNFAIGEGSDIANTFHYYCFGDPIALLSAFFPLEYMPFGYTFILILRHYLAGVAFSEMCFGFKLKNKTGILVAAVSYALCYWSLYAVTKHPFFGNPMIYFPLIVLGVEKILQGKKPYLLTVVIAIAAASNFYFFYMITILTVIYSVMRAIYIYGKDVKVILTKGLHVFLSSLVGVMISSLIFIPVVFTFLGDSRFGAESNLAPLYPRIFYSKLPGLFFNAQASYWLVIGLFAPTVLGVFLLFLKKGEHKFLKALYAAAAVMMLIPFFGSLLNGMSYMNNRWSWAFSLLACFTLATLWDDLISISKKERNRLLIMLLAAAAICTVATMSRLVQTYVILGLSVILVLIVYGLKEKNGRATSVVLIVGMLISIGNYGFWKDDPSQWDKIAVSITPSRAEKTLIRNEARAVYNLKGNDFVRYAGRNVNYNGGFLRDLSSTCYYWTLSNPHMNEYRGDLWLRENGIDMYEGYDDRTRLMTLAAVNYYVVDFDDERPAPFGYKKIDDYKEQYTVYKNQYALPLGYTYDKYIDRDQWEALSAVDKEQVLMEAVLVEENHEGLDKYQHSPENTEVEYEIEAVGDEVYVEAGCIVTTKSKQEAKLKFNAPKDVETYLHLENFVIEKTIGYDLYFGDETVDPENKYNEDNWEELEDERKKKLVRQSIYGGEASGIAVDFIGSNGMVKDITYMNEDDIYYYGKDDFIVNMGEFSSGENTITITFPVAGVYYVDDIKIYCLPTDAIAEEVEKLKESKLTKVKYGTNSLKGSISSDKTKFLCVAIPYSKGWSAYMDGEEVPIYLANEHYLGIDVPPGDHDLELKYERPYRKVGLAVSALGLIISATYIIMDKRRKAPKKQ